MSSSASKRSTTIPLSFDRFRIKSIQFLSPFRIHHCDKQIKQTQDRSRIRKIQVHPHDNQSSKCNQINSDAAYLFHVDKYVYKNPQMKKRPSNIFYTRATSYSTRTVDIYKTPNKTTFRPSAPDIREHHCPPTPYMIDYRHSSLPNLAPKLIIKSPQSSNQSIKKSDSMKNSKE